MKGTLYSSLPSVSSVFSPLCCARDNVQPPLLPRPSCAPRPRASRPQCTHAMGGEELGLLLLLLEDSFVAGGRALEALIQTRLDLLRAHLAVALQASLHVARTPIPIARRTAQRGGRPSTAAFASRPRSMPLSPALPAPPALSLPTPPLPCAPHRRATPRGDGGTRRGHSQRRTHGNRGGRCRHLGRLHRRRRARHAQVACIKRSRGHLFLRTSVEVVVVRACRGAVQKGRSPCVSSRGLA